MPNPVIPPRRDDGLVSERDTASQRHQRFFEEVADHINDLETNAVVIPPVAVTDFETWDTIVIPAGQVVNVLLSTAGGSYIEATVAVFSVVGDEHVGFRITASRAVGTSVLKSTSDVEGSLKRIQSEVVHNGSNFTVAIRNNTANTIQTSGRALTT